MIKSLNYYLILPDTVGMKIILLCIVITIVSYLESHAVVNPENYQDGEFLIYNCREKHWACVKSETFDECLEDRNADPSELDPLHSCAPVGRFATTRSCFDRQSFMSTQAFGTRVCVRDEWKGKISKF
ncbi:MAG TPA: hypothetical protein VNJ01_01480 [Bacteriovoracaceae bacterium]|nr:hypothetical protein [Bacteriovoracaceae bacterium]